MKTSAEEIIRQMNLLDCAYPEYRFISDDHKSRRLRVAVESLSDFTETIIIKARNNLIKSSGDRLPSIGEVYEACLEAEIDLAAERAPKQHQPIGKPVEHPCTPLSEFNEAFIWTRIVAPYEASHAKCQGEIQATCPLCGKHYGPVVSPFLERVIEMFPEQTKEWNPYHKGKLPCPECEAEQTRSEY